MEGDRVRFQYKDYRADGAESRKTMVLAATEFIRRFLFHVLPSGFHRIRYYGLLGNRHRQAKLTRCRQLLKMPALKANGPTRSPSRDYRDRYEALTGISFRTCPLCRAGRMHVIEHLMRIYGLITDTS